MPVAAPIQANTTLAEPGPRSRLTDAHAMLRTVLIRGGSAVFIIQVVGGGLSYLLQIGLARWGGSASYGVYAYAYGWTRFMAAICGLGLTTAVLKLVPKYVYEKDWGRLRGLMLHTRGITVGAAVVCAVAMSGFAVTRASRNMTWGLVIAAALVPLLALANLQTQLLRGFQKLIAAYAPGGVLRPALAGAIAYLAFRATGKLTGETVLLILIVVFSVVVVLEAGLLRKETSRQHNPRREYDLKMWWGLAAPMFLIALLQILPQTGVLMVGLFKGARAAGLYNAAARTAYVISYFHLAFNSASAPMISRLHISGDHDGLKTLAKTVAHAVFWPAIFLALAMAIFSRPLMFLFGRDFLSARPAFLILVADQLVMAMTGSVGYFLLLTGYQLQTLKVYATASAISLTLSVTLVPTLGLVGAGVASLVTTAFWNFSLVVMVKRRLGVISLPIP